MRRLSLRTVVALTVPAVFVTPAALAQQYGDAPAAIALFSQENFYGDIRDVFDPFGTLKDLAFNDRTRSVAVFAGQWELCEHKNFTGRCVYIREDVSDLGWFGLAGKVTSVRPIYEYTEAHHGLLFSRDKYGYIRYANNETYGYDTWNYGYASSWGISVSHYGYSPDYYRYGYYSPTWGYDPYGFAWGPRNTIRYTTTYRRHPRPSVLNPYWSGWDWRPSDWRRGNWSWRDGRRGHDDWRRDDRDGRDGRGGGGRDGRPGDGDGRDGRGGRDGRDDRPNRDVPGDRWGPGAGGSGTVTPIPNDPRPGRDGRSGRDGRDGRDGRGSGSWTPGAGTGTSVTTPPVVAPRDPRPGRDVRGGGAAIVTPPADLPRDPRPGREGRGGRGGDTGSLLGGPDTDGRRGGTDDVRGRGGPGGDTGRGGGRSGDGASGGGRPGAGARSVQPVAASPPPPPPPPPPARDDRRGSGSDDDGRGSREVSRDSSPRDSGKGGFRRRNGDE